MAEVFLEKGFGVRVECGEWSSGANPFGICSIKGGPDCHVTGSFVACSSQ